MSAQDSVAVLLGKLRCLGTLLQQLNAQTACAAVNEAIDAIQALTAPPGAAAVGDAAIERECEAVARRDGIDWNDPEWHATHKIEAGRLRARMAAALATPSAEGFRPDWLMRCLAELEAVAQREASAGNTAGHLHADRAAAYIREAFDRQLDPRPKANRAATPAVSVGDAKDAEVPCSTHPDAPHGFDRNGSHNAGRYVCDCEGWTPDTAANIVRDLCELDPYDPEADDAVCVQLRDLDLIIRRNLSPEDYDAAIASKGDSNG